MRQNMRRQALLAVLSMALASCDLRPPYLLVTVEDPDNLAAGFATMVVGTAPEKLQQTKVDKRTLPLTLTVTVRKAGEQDVWVEARDNGGEAMARGRTTARFAKVGTPTATVVLRNACAEDNQCAAIGFCSGTKRCLSTVCGCVESQCGDAFHDPMTEECDDGNTDSADSCTADCKLAGCGDGFLWAGVEACDDGNATSGDGCRADCRKVEVCGDGIIDAGEDCDDGNSNPNDGCYAIARSVDPNGCRRVQWAESVLVGLGPARNIPREISLTNPKDVEIDRAGNTYVADGRIWRIDASTGASLRLPTQISVLASSLALDGKDNVYAANAVQVFRIDALTGAVQVIAGNGTRDSYSGDGGPAVAAGLAEAAGIAVDWNGNVLIADLGANRIRRVDQTTGIIETVAGNGAAGYSGDGEPATAASLWYPSGVAVDGQGNVFIADVVNGRIRRVDQATGIIETLAGVGYGYAGDGGPATLALLNMESGVSGISLDRQGNLFLADCWNFRVRKIDAVTGIIDTVAGNGVQGFGGDGNAANLATLNSPGAVAVDASGNLYIADTVNRRIRRVDAIAGTIDTVVGGGAAGIGDGGPARTAHFFGGYSVVADADNNLLVADQYNYRVRRIDAATGTITTVAGNGVGGYSGDGGDARFAELGLPRSVALNLRGDLFIAEWDARVRKVDHSSGMITTVAGGPTWGFSGDDGPATDAQLNSAMSVVVDSADNMYIADDNRVRRVDGATGIITTFAGTGGGGFSGEGVDARLATLSRPASLTVDGSGNLIIADTWNHRIRQVDAGTHVITTIAGDGTAGFAGDEGPAVGAQLDGPMGVVVDPGNNIYVADMLNARIRRIDAVTGVITTVAGNGIPRAFRGDFGPAIDAQIDAGGVGFDRAGNLLIGGSAVIRRVDRLTGIITTIAGAITPDGDGPLAASALSSPWSWTYADSMIGTIVADGASGRLRRIDWTGQALATVAGYQGVNVDSQAPSSFAYQSRLLMNPFGVAYVPSLHAVLLSERDGHTLRSMRVDEVDPLLWTVETYAGALPRSACCRRDDDEACSVDELADTSCADDSPGYADEGPGGMMDARFDHPSGLLYDPNDRDLGEVIYVADAGNHVIRRILLPDGHIETIAGIARQRGFYGDGVDATDSLLDDPQAIALGPKGTATERSLCIADTGNHRVRRLDLDTGILTTVIGDGVPASSGIGAPARYFPVDEPKGLAIDHYGNLFVSSRNGVRLVYAGADGIATGDDYVTTIYGTTPRESFPMSVTKCLSGIGFEPGVADDQSLLFLDACQGFLVRLTRNLVQQ
jgi:cysteine-rich repeat protein